MGYVEIIELQEDKIERLVDLTHEISAEWAKRCAKMESQLAEYRRLEAIATEELENVGEHSLHNVACYMDAIRKIEDLEQQLATLRHVKKYEIEELEAKLAQFAKCEDILCPHCHDVRE